MILMRVLPILCLLLSSTTGDRSAPMRWARTLVGARLDSQQTRLNALEERLHHLVLAVSRPGSANIRSRVHGLTQRIGFLEGDSCPDNTMSCGRDSAQCVSVYLVCDNHTDCDNGHDESLDVCHNPVQAGTTWTGHVTWRACITRPNDVASIVITSNTPSAWLPSQLHLTAVGTSTSRKDGKMVSYSFPMEGTYYYGRRQFVLQPSDAGALRIVTICGDAGPGLIKCRFIQESSLAECGHAYLTASH